MMPYSVISGFMSGIGVLLIITQIGPLLGHPAPSGGAIGEIPMGLPQLVVPTFTAAQATQIVVDGVVRALILLVVVLAVAAGVFVANVLTIERLSNLPSTRVRTIDPSGDPVVVNDEEARDRLGRLGVLSGRVELTGDRLTALRDAVSLLDE
jgi:MFS superfamily sulfate permease-like transporter